MNQDEILKIIKILKKEYPDAKCSLNFNNSFELLIAVILSAQCTDDRVNKTMPSIFKKCSKPIDFVKIPLNELEKLIHPCGFYKVKSKNIKATSKKIIDEFNGQVPDNIKDLMSLPGVGRKTANVIMCEAFKNPQGIAVDTHAKRISNKIGLSKNQDPLKIEQDLLKQIPNKYYKDINHLFIWHGRNTCTAKNPKCNICCINKYCANFNTNNL